MSGLSAAWGLVRAWHGWVARWPAPLARTYLSVLGGVTRLGPFGLGAWMRNATFGVSPFDRGLMFAPRTVRVGRATDIRLTPHIGEFDAMALFARSLDYEFESFAWLEQAAKDYDVVVEIGANVGVFTVFLDRVTGGGPTPRRIFAFEPAAEPFRRLQENLAANRVRRVSAYPAAVGETSGFLPFFEPAGHLTNGSFVREFAAIFSDDVRETQVLCCAGADLVALARTGERVLLKIDVEGYEPVLLQSLAPFIATHRPDVLIEVLEQTEKAIAAFAKSGGYACFQLGDEGLEPQPSVFADPQRRDWLLRPPAG